MMDIINFQKHILRWYEEHQRDLPWRKTRDPYKILVSEIMLQQTQVSRVLPKYDLFLKTFPTVQDLASASDDKLLSVWSGLGYWRRAKFLKESAKVLLDEYGGEFPQTPEALLKLPGVGPYTAGAVACFAFNSTSSFIDTNIRRVYLHFFFGDRYEVTDKEIIEIAELSVWKKDPRAWHWALFDYGAIELKKMSVNKRSKHYTKQSTFKGSFRSYRAKTLKYMLLLPKKQIPEVQLLEFLEDILRQDERDYAPEDILYALMKDKLIHKKNDTYYL